MARSLAGGQRGRVGVIAEEGEDEEEESEEEQLQGGEAAGRESYSGAGFLVLFSCSLILSFLSRIPHHTMPHMPPCSPYRGSLPDSGGWGDRVAPLMDACPQQQPCPQRTKP